MKKLRKLVALVRRTFLTDCPKCHKHFYGFHDHGVQVKLEGVHYRVVCHRCHKDCQKDVK